jgi:hypothetical protein
LLLRRSDVGVAKDKTVGADAHDVVLRERYGAVDELLIHEGPIRRFEIRENCVAGRIAGKLGVESGNAARRIFENDLIIVAASYADERADALEYRVRAVGAINEEAAH